MQRAPGPPRRRARLLGDQRRETAEAIHSAAARRRAREGLGDDVEEEDGFGGGGGERVLGDDDGGVFADAVYERDDEEADAVYAAVETRMESKGKRRREDRMHDEVRKYREANPTIKMQFADLREGLGMLSNNDWSSIPDIGDYTVKKRKIEKFTPAPDSLLESARQETAFVASAPAHQGTATDLAAIGAGRTSVLGQKLDRAGDSVGGQSNIDPTGYLTEMAGVHITTDSEIGDIKKARLLLKSVTTTNPNHAPGWIAAARLEEVAGKMTAARSLAGEGCRMCAKEEDVWLESARLHSNFEAKRVLAQAVKFVPKSVKVWLQASALEDDVKMKRRVLRRALEVIPLSARLWRAAVELEEPAGARILLSRAVECVPSATDLWVALARLESYEDAKVVLSRAREAVPADPAIWITAAKLEEAHVGRESPRIIVLLRKAVESLSESSDVVKRDRWMQEAREADKAGFPGTVFGLVHVALGLGVDDMDREDVWLEDAEVAEAAMCKEVARAIYASLTTTFPAKAQLWRKYADFEKRTGSSDKLQQVLSRAVGYCAKAEVLWLMLAKDKWVGGDVDAARVVLTRAFEANPDSEAIWLAAAKVETESGEYERARSLLAKARAQAPSGQVYMKSALLERQLQNRLKERKLLEEGLREYPKTEKLWLMLAQWHERADAVGTLAVNGVGACESPVTVDARSTYAKAVVESENCVMLWVGFARLEERAGAVSKARAILERGRQKNRGRSDMDVLWRESVFLEVRASGTAAVDSLLARALQECPSSGKLWALAMALEPRARQNAKSVDALKHCGQDALVMVEVGKVFWRGRKVDKARSWLNRSVKLDQDLGDAWAALHAFERECGTDKVVYEVERRAVQADPKHGDIWTAVRKKIGNETMTTLDVLRSVSSGSSCLSSTNGLYPL